MRSHKNIVVTLMFNKPELTNRLINDLLKNERENIDKIILIDNGSTEDNIAEFLKFEPIISRNKPSESSINFDIDRLEANIGFTLGANYGLLKAVKESDPQDLIFLISNDVQINGKFIDDAENILHGAKRSLVGNRHIGWDSGWNTFGGRVFDYLEGYFLAATSRGWNDLGFFDPAYAPYDYEDIDLSTHARSKGYKLVSLNNPNIVHVGAGTLGYNPQREKITLRNKEYFRSKWVKE